ncbi:hypothetical protein QQF64_017318 [Cirrhinus molitorella]|uniref:SWIM-type domain-containing protein n=1 Tax=Cirrhinus molitorella TaxID=172907 RepID=A0ABR3LJX7_9TELE
MMAESSEFTRCLLELPKVSINDQGSSSIHDYTLHFRTLAAASGWDEVALLGAYRHGLNSNIKAAMAFYDDSIGLEAFLQQTTRITQRLAACQPLNPAPQSTSVAARAPVPEPMQVDSNRLTQTERTRCLTSGLCLYCGNPGHVICNCPVRPPRPVITLRDATPVVLARSSCSCVAGRALCNHLIALLYQAAHFSESGIAVVPPVLSCTETEQKWHKPRTMGVKPGPVDAMVVVKPKPGATATSGIRSTLYKAYGGSFQFCQHSTPQFTMLDLSQAVYH